jgi:hypothetical protein
MTDRENFGGSFLERWSRRKSEAERQAADTVRERDAAQAPDDKAGDKPQAASEQESAHDTQAPLAARDNASATPDSKPTFDIASLPSLDSITAASDVRAFLTPGVPAELTRAALRRAWAADPAIRDFKGLAENDWDFTDPKAMAGFGDLPADFDVRKLVAQIFGEPDGEAQPKAAEPDTATATSVQEPAASSEIAAVADAAPAETEGDVIAETVAPEAGAPSESDFVHRTTNVVLHNNIPLAEELAEEAEELAEELAEEDETKTRRTHGRALPQ